MSDIEIWKDVVGYEGYYEVSNTGKVRNAITQHILSPGISQGYYYVALYKDTVRHNKQVNRLVAEAFLDNTCGYPMVNHKNEIKTDNNVDNLEWCTYSYNNSYGGAPKRRGDGLKGHKSWNKGKKMSDNFRQKVSNGMKESYRRRKSNIE